MSAVKRAGSSGHSSGLIQGKWGIPQEDPYLYAIADFLESENITFSLKDKRHLQFTYLNNRCTLRMRYTSMPKKHYWGLFCLIDTLKPAMDRKNIDAYVANANTFHNIGDFELSSDGQVIYRVGVDCHNLEANWARCIEPMFRSTVSAVFLFHDGLTKLVRNPKLNPVDLAKVLQSNSAQTRNGKPTKSELPRDKTKNNFLNKRNSIVAEFQGQRMAANQNNEGRKLKAIRENEIEYIELLGRGGFGEVHRGKYLGVDVAIKKVRKETDRAHEIFAEETRIMEQLAWRNIVQLIGISEDPRLIVMEYMENGSLADVLKKNETDWKQRLHYMLDAASGMNYLHHSEIIHGDLKPANMLIDSRHVLKISDFGLSINQTSVRLHGMTPKYAAPEMLLKNTLVQASDVFAFGLILWEVAEMTRPWKGMDKAAVEIALRTRQRPQWSTNMQASIILKPYREIAEQCWEENPQDRPTFTRIHNALYSLHQSKALESYGSGNALGTIEPGALPPLTLSNTPSGSPVSERSKAASPGPGIGQVPSGSAPTNPHAKVTGNIPTVTTASTITTNPTRQSTNQN